jgi:alkylation response protein AidB-like acyl-CoA dehydrogenase
MLCNKICSAGAGNAIFSRWSVTEREMNVRLSEEQRAWQEKARKFAQEEIRPISLARDRIADAPATFDWDVICKGSRLGFRTAVVAKPRGRHGLAFITPALQIAERADAGSAGQDRVRQSGKWRHLHAEFVGSAQPGRCLKPSVDDDT